ncbi:unnamed protein product [Rhizopus stolonifer]
MPNTQSTQVTEEPIKDSLQDAREKKYQERKKRDSCDIQTPKQKVMAQFLTTIIEFDKRRILWSENKENKNVALDSIEDRVYKGKYEDLDSFKSDIDALFLSVLPSTHSSKQDMSTFKSLYQFAQDCLKFESKRLNEEIKTESVYKTVALFRPSVDGFAFSDTTMKEKSAVSNHDLPQNIYEMVIHPTQPAKQEEVPNLRQTVAPSPNYPPKTMKHEDKPVVPIQWLDFGAFSSFAPTYDSNNANITYESTNMGRASKRLKTFRKEEGGEENSDELNAEWLAKEGLDLQLIENALNKEPENIQEELEQNSRLLEQLASYQESRFKQGESVDNEELQAAELLQKNMINILSKLPPNATVNSNIVEKSMESIPLCEPAYRGSLQPHKIFSYPTSEKAEILPPYSNVTPTYTKEDWRLVKVPQINDQDRPLISMVEQQQINFYTKPPGFNPQQTFVPQQQQQRK